MVEFKPRERKGIRGTSLGSQKARTRKAQENEREKDLGNRLHMQVQPASGAMAAHKGDLRDDSFLFDSKSSASSSIVITGQELSKISREANGERRIPGLVVTIKEIPSTTPREWIMIPLDDFMAIKEQLANGTP